MNRPLYSADPKAAYLAAQAEIDAAIRRVLSSGRYILGPEVEAFESEFAAFLAGGAEPGAADSLAAVGVASGTDALELALRALGVGPGDRVATVANTVSATAAAIVATGAAPVFVEIDCDTLLMDPAALEAVLERVSGIRAIVPVHLYGRPCDLPLIVALARRRGVPVVEDCAQAHGASIDGRKAGTWGDLAAFSFYPTKNLGALGDGGAVVGRDRGLVESVRRLRQYGWRTRYVSDGPGRNSRLDELQAAVLRVLLPRLDSANARRAQLAERYLKGLGPGVTHPAGVRPGNPPAATPAGASGSLRLPAVPVSGVQVWHQFVVRSPRRDALAAHLARRDIHCGVLYPVPLHRQPAFAESGHPDLPATERACAEVLSLPLHPGVTEADVDRVCAAIADF